MNRQRDAWRFLRIGFIILPLDQMVEHGSHRLAFRGLDRYPGLPFNTALHDDPQPLQDLFQQVKRFIDGADFFQEATKAGEVCAELNAILLSLRGRGESLGSFDAAYEVVGCNVEGAAREVLERITGRALRPADPPDHLLGYDVALADSDFSAINHGLFGFTRWLDEFFAEVNEHGLFPNPHLADRFRQAYRASPSHEESEPFLHELFLPEPT